MAIRWHLAAPFGVGDSFDGGVDSLSIATIDPLTVTTEKAGENLEHGDGFPRCADQHGVARRNDRRLAGALGDRQSLTLLGMLRWIKEPPVQLSLKTLFGVLKKRCPRSWTLSEGFSSHNPTRITTGPRAMWVRAFCQGLKQSKCGHLTREDNRLALSELSRALEEERHAQNARTF